MSYQSTLSNPYSSGAQRPGAPRTTSSNYAQAQALYAAKKHCSTSSSSGTTPSLNGAQLPVRSLNPTDIEKVDGKDVGKKIDEGRRFVGDVTAGAGWTPRYVQVQSWNEQDMKREFQMARLAETTGAGFSEVGK